MLDLTFNFRGEEFTFQGGLSQRISVIAKGHTTFGSDDVIGEAEFALEEHISGEFWLPLNGAETAIKLRIAFKPIDVPDLPVKSSSSPFGKLRGKS